MKLRFVEEAAHEFYRAVEYYEEQSPGLGGELLARSKGMTEVARDAGLSRESLYKALSGERTPNFDTILKVVGALGLTLHAEAAPRAK